MTDKRTDDPAMADILASIRKIVAEDDPRRADRRLSTLDGDGDVLVLTRAMLIEEGAKQPERPSASAMFGGPAPQPIAPVSVAPTSEPQTRTDPPQETGASLVTPSALDLGAEAGLDEAAIADIVRQVLREEFEGDFGRNLTQQIRRLVHAEVTKTLASPAGGSGA